MAKVAKEKRDQALALRLRQWSPYERSEFHVAWQGGEALVWAWDADRLEASLSAHGLGRSQVEVLPEPALRQSDGDGLRLVACFDGFEAQHWIQGDLRCARWWPTLPREVEWIKFQRDAGIGPDAQSAVLPRSVEQPLTMIPWAQRDGRGAEGLRFSREKVVVSGLAIALALATSWYLIGWTRLHLARAEKMAQLERMSPEVEPALQAQRSAVDALSRVKALRSLEPFPDQLFLMARVGQGARQMGATLKEWDYRSGRLQFALSPAAAASTSAFVKAFQVQELFENVRVAPSNSPDVLLMSMDVVPFAAVALDGRSQKGDSN